MPRYSIPAFAGMTEEGWRVGKRVDPHRLLPAIAHTPVIPGGVKRRPGIHAEVLDSRVRGNDGGGGFGMCGNALIRVGYQLSRPPVIPGGVKRRPGIHAGVLDSRFRGNDGGGRQVWKCPDPHQPPAAPRTPLFRAGRNGDLESTPGYWIPAFAGMTAEGGRCGNVLLRIGLRPSHALPLFRAEWNGDPESMPRRWIPAFAGMTGEDW